MLKCRKVDEGLVMVGQLPYLVSVWKTGGSFYGMLRAKITCSVAMDKYLKL